MLDRKISSFGYKPSALHSISLNSEKIKTILSWRQPKKKPLKGTRNRYVISAEAENIPPPQPQKNHDSMTENVIDDENLMETDEHPINDFRSSFIGSDSKSSVNCPHCYRSIDSVVEKLTEEIKSWASTNSASIKFEDSQLSEKVRTHYFPAKKSFIAESLNTSHVNESISDLKGSLHSTPIIVTQRTIVKTQKSEDMSRLLYELAEHKAKLAEALHSNDENLHELQKKESELKNLEAELEEKEKFVAKLEKENFLVKQEHYKCKETIHELNSNHKMLLKDFNRFTKPQICLKG